MAESNWDEIKQSIVDELAYVKNDLLTKAKHDIVETMVNNGLISNRIKTGSNTVSYQPSDVNDFENGKILFNKIFEKISESSWFEEL